MARDFASERNRDGMSQQPSTSITVIADAQRDACEPRQGSGFERVLKENRAIEVTAPQFRSNVPLFRKPFQPRGAW